MVHPLYLFNRVARLLSNSYHSSALATKDKIRHRHHSTRRSSSGKEKRSSVEVASKKSQPVESSDKFSTAQIQHDTPSTLYIESRYATASAHSLSSNLGRHA